MIRNEHNFLAELADGPLLISRHDPVYNQAMFHDLAQRGLIVTVMYRQGSIICVLTNAGHKALRAEHIEDYQQ